MEYNWIAATPFGIEGITARELRAMGLEAKAQNGGAVFAANEKDAFRANMWLRSADRISLLLGKFPARSFEELFEGIYALPWGDILPEDAEFPVTGKCVRAQLMSLSDCQSITKKAIARKLEKKYRRALFPEDGAMYRVQVALMGDECTVSLNASGDALNRRGYRQRHTEAPVRETLAAALLLASPFRRWEPQAFLDPMCGSGTLAVEAAMIRYERAPGLSRSFDCEQWHFFQSQDIQDIRHEAEEAFREALLEDRGVFYASDIDPEAVEVTRVSARDAGLADKLTAEVRNISQISLPEENGFAICNPPYGARLGDKESADQAALLLGNFLRKHPSWQLGVLTPQQDFERIFGRRALRRRRVYNGRIECEFMTFGLNKVTEGNQ